MKNQKLSGGSKPVSAQLRSPLRQEQPPRTSLPLSRTVAQLLASPSFQELISNPSYVSDPTLLCVDDVVPNGGSYLSRRKLLREMYRRWVHYRSINRKEAENLFNFSTNGFQPVSAQLRSSLRQKQPARTSLPLSRTVAQPLASPSFQELISNPSYVSVPTLWSVDYVVPTGGSYLSRGKLLREMYRRKVHYRSFNRKEAEKLFNFSHFMQGIEVLGAPVDYWLTFPLQQPPNDDNQECNLFSGLPEDFKEDELARGWVIGPVNCTRKMLNTHVGVGKLPADNRLTFPWVTNSNSTNLLSLDDVMMLNDNFDIRKVDGFVECVECGEIMGIGYLLPGRFHVAAKHIFSKMDQLLTDSERVLSVKSEFGCVCQGRLNPRVPVISENLRKINWVFLFLGINLGVCTEEQLRYYCYHRKIPSLGKKKNQLLRFVCLDLCNQMDPESTFRDAGAQVRF